MQRRSGDVGFGIVLHALERNLRFQPILLLVKIAHAVKTLLHTRLSHRLPSVNEPAPKLQRLRNSIQPHLEVAIHHGRSETRASAAIHLKGDAHLLVSVVPFEDRMQIGFEEAIHFHEALLRRLGLLQFGFGVRLPQIEIAGAGQLVRAGRRMDFAGRPGRRR